MFISYNKTHVKILVELFRETSYVIYFGYIFPVIHFRMSRIEFYVGNVIDFEKLVEIEIQYKKTWFHSVTEISN